ncbi:hypothetical protein KVT40_005615 [Elsinoe batatas]|uniref:Ubiquitin-like 1-activating enzyme E1A n=1 Tax=Elsinoe batatas TaxID=2601811 RepID=A0A8K0PCA4_9PEZI|nr:hypothetical protein KVT40_005615 [Elsinoe batatas]
MAADAVAPAMDGPMIESMSTARSLPSLESQEYSLYDRQIRLWGVKAQERIRSAKVLLVNVKATGTEIAKNLILSGIGSLTISDTDVVQENDLGAQYFLRTEDVGSSRAVAAATRLQELNPRVAVVADTGDVTLKGPDYFSAFDMVIASDMPFFMLSMVNAGTRISGCKFYACGTQGFYGFVFADLIQHEYIIEREQSNRNTALSAESTTRTVVGVNTKKENGKNIEMVTKRETYTPLMLANSSPLPDDYIRNRRRMKGVSPLLPAFRALWDFERSTGRFPGHAREDLVSFTQLINEKLKELQLSPDLLKSDFLRNFLQGVGAEIVPTAAFVGGRLAEDVINVLGKREQPIQNMLLFDGESFQAPIYALHPIFDASLLPTNGSLTTIPAAVQNSAQQPNSGSSNVSNGFAAAQAQPQPPLEPQLQPEPGRAKINGNDVSAEAPSENGRANSTGNAAETSVGPVAIINPAPAPTNASPRP